MTEDDTDAEIPSSQSLPRDERQEAAGVSHQDSGHSDVRSGGTSDAAGERIVVDGGTRGIGSLLMIVLGGAAALGGVMLAFARSDVSGSLAFGAMLAGVVCIAGVFRRRSSGLRFVVDTSGIEVHRGETRQRIAPEQIEAFSFMDPPVWVPSRFTLLWWSEGKRKTYCRCFGDGLDRAGHAFIENWKEKAVSVIERLVEGGADVRIPVMRGPYAFFGSTFGQAVLCSGMVALGVLGLAACLYYWPQPAGYLVCAALLIGGGLFVFPWGERVRSGSSLVLNAQGIQVDSRFVPFGSILETGLFVRGEPLAYLRCALDDGSEVTIPLGHFRAETVRQFVDRRSRRLPVE